MRSDQCVRICWKWKCVPLDIWRKLLVILLRLTLVFWVASVFYKRMEIAKNAALSETVVILMLP